MNKKLFCLASLAALTLAGCGETPEPGPGPDPEPVVPTVADLEARFVGLGESYKATVSTPAAEGETEGGSLDILVNADYLYAGLFGVAKFASGKYYYAIADFEEEEGEESELTYEGQWGVVYQNAEEYANAVFLKNQEFDASSWAYNKQLDAFKASSAIAGELNFALGLADLELNSKNLLAKLDAEDETRVVLEFYTTAAFNTIAYTVSIAPTTERAEGFEAWVAAQEEDPVAPFAAGDVTAAWYAYKNYTAETSFGEDLIVHDYVTKDSKTIARDGAWTGYEKYKSTVTYANVGAGKNIPAGVYAYSSTNVDPEKDYDDFINGLNGPEQVGDSSLGAFWNTPGYVNPTTAWYYGYTDLVTEEVLSEYGQALRVRPETTYIGSDEQEHEVGLDAVATLGELLGIYDLFDEERQYDGYVFESIDYLDMYFAFDEEAEAYTYATVEEIFVVISGIASYKSFNEDGTIDVEAAEEFYTYVDFYDFGVTEDPYGAVIFNTYATQAQAVATDLEMVVGETAAAVYQTSMIAGTAFLSLDNKGTQSDDNLEIIANEDGSYSIYAKAAGEFVVYVVVNGALITYFTVTVTVPNPDTFAGYWVNAADGLIFELNEDGTGTYSDGTNEFTVEFDPESGKITGGTFISAAGFDAEDSFFSWDNGNLVCNYSQDYGDQKFTKTFVAAEKPEEDAGFTGRWVSGDYVITIDKEGNGTFNNGDTEFTFTIDAEGNVTGGSLTAVWDGESSVKLTDDGKLNVTFADEYLENVYTGTFTRG